MEIIQNGLKKLIATMTQDVMDFIQQSPFAVLSTSDANGSCDASPRGGTPGFIKILNEKTLLIPDVKGNKLFQSYSNILENPHAALVFFIPGNDRMVRVNGTVKILKKEEIQSTLTKAEVNEPDENAELIQALVLTIHQAYSHCPRALKFSNLWQS